MSQRPSDRLSIDRIARRWTAETDKVGFEAEDIAEDLIDAALRGEFQYSPKGDWRSPIPDEPLEELLPITDCQTSERAQPQSARATWSGTIFPPTGAPTNYDPRLAMLIETFDRDGNPINSSQLQTYVDARKTAPGATDRETRRIVAREIFLSIEGLRRWCEQPEFAERAQLRGLLRPSFIDRANGDGPGQAPETRKEKRARQGEQDAPQAHDAQLSTPAKADQAQTYDELKDWFVKVYMPTHEEDSPNPTRDAALSAATLEFPNYCDKIHLRDDLREIWRDHAQKGWKRTGPRAKTE